MKVIEQYFHVEFSTLWMKRQCVGIRVRCIIFGSAVCFAVQG